MLNVISCNNINDLYAKLCVHNVVENINDKVFNLMSITNETRHNKYVKKEYVIKDLLNHDKLCDVWEYLDYKYANVEKN